MLAFVSATSQPGPFPQQPPRYQQPSQSQPPQSQPPLPDGPPGALYAHDRPVPTQYQPPLRRATLKVGAPLAALIVLGVLVLLFLVFLALVDPGVAIVGGLLSSVAIGLVLLALLWLDRWEPEPPRLLLFAFLWGAGLCTTVAIVINSAAEMLIGGAVAVFVAPIVEELLKGSFLLLMLTGRRRKEMTSLTDCLVFAGITAAGFAWVEDILYLVQNPDSFGVVAVMRLVFSPFAHPLFTAMTGIGVYLSMRQRSGGMKALCIIGGFVAAILLHATWNAAPTFLGLEGFILVYVLFMVPVFAGMIVLAALSRRSERRTVVKHLPGLVREGILTPGQAGTLDSLAHRKLGRQQAEASGGPAAKAAYGRLVDAATELAHVRDRYDRGLADQRLAQLHAELVASLQQARTEAPALNQLSAPPVAGPPAMGGPPMQQGPMQQGPMQQRPMQQPPPPGPPPPHR